MYNPMIMQASCTMYSLVSYCNGENERDLQPVLYPFSTPLVSEDFDAEALMAMNQGGRSPSLIGILGSLLGGIGTLVDVTQLLATVQKALNSPTADVDKWETAEADGSSSSDQSSILGPPPLMSCKPSTHGSSQRSQFAFNHVLASHIQAQLLQRLTMPASEEPVPLEARIPISSLGGVVSLFDLPLVRPLVAKSSQKAATELCASSSQSAAEQTPTSSAPVAATGDSILGCPPVPRFHGPLRPPQNSVVPMPPSGSGVRPGPLRGPAVRPLAGRNFAGAGNWPRTRGDIRPVMVNQGGERKPLPGGWKGGGNIRPGADWQWKSETAGDTYEGQHWNSGAQGTEPDWTSYSGQPSMKPAPPPGSNMARGPHRPPVGQSAGSSLRGKPPQVWYMFCALLICLDG